jgi:hypothetical protein
MAWAVVFATAQAPQNTAEAIAYFEDSCRHYEQIAATLEVHNKVITTFAETDTSLPPDHLVSISTLRYWRAGERLRILENETRRRMNLGRLSETADSAEWILAPDLDVQAPRNPATGKLAGRNLIAHNRTPSDRRIRQLSFKAGLPFSGAIDVLGPGLAEQMSAAAPAVSTEISSGRQVLRLNFSTDWGEHSVWLDPSRGYHLLRLTQRKLGHHLVAPGERLDQVDDPKLKVVEIDNEVIVESLRKVNGAWFVDRYAINNTLVDAKSGRSDRREHSYRVVDLSTDPLAYGNEFKFVTEIANGTRVNIADKTPVRYEWQNGVIVKSIDQTHAKSLANQEFKKSSNYWIWIAGALVVVGGLALAFMWWRRPLVR